MDKAFVWITDKTEWCLSQWWGVLAYILLMIAFLVVWDWDGIDRFVYVTNGIIVVVLLNASKRDSLAAQKKLDDLVPEVHKQIESLTEKELKDL